MIHVKLARVDGECTKRRTQNSHSCNIWTGLEYGDRCVSMTKVTHLKEMAVVLVIVGIKSLGLTFIISAFFTEYRKYCCTLCGCV